MGDTIKNSGKICLKTVIPLSNAKINLIHNGKKISSIENNEGSFIVDKAGQYRVEVYIKNMAWIFSNHIRIEN